MPKIIVKQVAYKLLVTMKIKKLNGFKPRTRQKSKILYDSQNIIFIGKNMASCVNGENIQF